MPPKKRHLRPVNDRTSRSRRSPKPKPTNDWSTDNGYDPLNLYTGATDDRGHDAQVHFRIPPATLGRMAALVESRSISGYKTQADFFRDAVTHRLIFVEREMAGHPEIAAQIEREAAMALLARRVEQDLRTQEAVESIIEGIKAIVRTEGESSKFTQRRLEGFRAQAEMMDPHYGAKVLSEIDRWSKA